MSTAKPRGRVVVPVDTAVKRAWAAQLRRFQQAQKRDAFAFDEKYEAIGEIVEHDPPLYLAGGCKSFREFVDKYVHEDESVVRQWVDVAEHATPEEEALYSPTRLAALLGMLRAQSNAGTVPARIVWKNLRVPVRDARGRTTQVPALDASIAQIRQARKEILRHAGRVAQGQSATQTAARDALAEAGLPGVTVKWADGVFAFGGVPGYQLREFARALLKAADASERDAAGATRKKSAARATTKKPSKHSRKTAGK